MTRKAFDKNTAKDIPAPPEPVAKPPADAPTDFHRTVSDVFVKEGKMKAKAVEEKTMPRPPPDWVLWVGEWLVGTAVTVYICTCLFYVAVFGMKLRPYMVARTYIASSVGAAILFFVFETVKCIVIAAVQLMVHKSDQENDEITRRKIRMLQKKQHLEKRQAGMKTLLVQPSGSWLWGRA
jgi:hypothetical protein